MLINVRVTKEELGEMGFDDNDLVDHIIETLDDDQIELVAYNVNVTII